MVVALVAVEVGVALVEALKVDLLLTIVGPTPTISCSRRPAAPPRRAALRGGHVGGRPRPQFPDPLEL
eukprot:2896395-Pyramimonas_sp.AAC.1